MGGVLGCQRLWSDRLGDFVMRRFLLALLLVAAPPLWAAEAMKVPSGQIMLPYEFLWEDHMDEGPKGEAWLILRFLSPEISKAGGRIKFEDAEKDIEYLCTKIGLPLVVATGAVDQIIVNLMDQPIARGQSDDTVTQFIGAYRVDKGRCEWTY